MEYGEAKSTFIKQWGDLGTKWGINRTMGQIHACLLISPEPLCTDQVMERLSVSRGNACMNLKALQEWGLIDKKCVDGCRKEYYSAEKDMYKVFRQIIIRRKKEELEPLVHMMETYAKVEEACPESSEFCKVMKDIRYFSAKADTTLDSILSTNPDWFIGSFLRMIR